MEPDETQRTSTDAGCLLGGERNDLLLGKSRSERHEDGHTKKHHVLGLRCERRFRLLESIKLGSTWGNHTSQHGFGYASVNLCRLSSTSTM